MQLSKSKQRIKDRREAVIAAYKDSISKGQSVSLLVASLAEQFAVTEVTIYNDLKPATKKP